MKKIWLRNLSGGVLNLGESWFFTSMPDLGTTHSLNCFKDAKNGFFGKFYIDIVNRFFSQLFFSIEKNIFKKWKKQFLKMKNSFKDFEFSSIKIFYNDFLIFQNFRFFDFSKFSIFQTKFSPRKKNIFCSDFFLLESYGYQLSNAPS